MRRHLVTALVLAGVLAYTPWATAQGLSWDFSPTNFLEEDPHDVYIVNQKNITTAWMTSFFVGAYSLGAVFYTKSVADSGDEAALADYKLYLAAIPLPIGTIYAERYWEAAVLTIGEGIASGLIYHYFSMSPSERQANENLFYIGVGLYATMWLFDMIYGPLMSHRYNKLLAQYYWADQEEASEGTTSEAAPSKEGDDSERIWDTGIRNTLLRPVGLTPYMMGTTFTF